MKKTLSIVLICGLLITIGGVSVFADSITSLGSTYSGTSFPGLGILQVYTSSTAPYYSEFNPFHNEIYSADQNIGYSTIAQEYTFNVRLSNDSNDPINCNTNYIRLIPALKNVSPASGDSIMATSYSVQDVTGYSDVIVTYTNGQIDILPNYSQRLIIPPHGRLMINFKIIRYTNVYSVNKTGATISSLDASITSCSIVQPTSAATYTSDAYIYDSNINSYYQRNALESLDQNVQSILDQYTANSQAAQKVTNDTQVNENTIATIGQNEDTWFSQNDQALTATGMDNFTYTPQVMSGLTVISDQFNQLWNAIGDWNFVYTFSMMIGLVVLILRHNPQRKKSSSGGKSNASSS